MSTRSFDGCIGRAIKLAGRMHSDGRWLMNEATAHLMTMPDAQAYLDHFRFNGAAQEIRAFIYDKKRLGKVNGHDVSDWPLFLCGPGNRWGYSADFNREELEAVLARRRRKQRGYDPECEALELIIAAMPTPKTLVGEVLN